MLSRLVLTDFRNHADLTLTPGPGFVVLTGENGAGKTNILEAVSLLAPGRGLRRAALGEMARQGGPGGFGVAATFHAGEDVELATGTLTTAPERRIYGPGHNSFTVDGRGRDVLVYHARDYDKITGDPLYDPNRHTRVQGFRYRADGTPDFGMPAANGPLSI